ncbi:hypothetical protein [Spirosoma montaniterrae]|uniref:Secretion system C-terminal sorting domain-containing protein n=1 Tax=Spirosoma montaniterrae TaxID=1178516 RepID=A0A1P9WYA1_9BACT|nr:hypothetical protein [Spirosoma montaniterrae]AQG80367.1 hypothetical protein AWR27_14175 [Spirosoma montaniterrae]
MKHLLIGWLMLLSFSVQSQPDLDFQSTQGGWTTGALTKTYTSIGTPARSVTVAISGATSELQANSPQAFARGLQVGSNFTTNSNCLTTTISFGTGVQGLTFRLLNIDRGQASGSLYNFVDQVTVAAKNGAATVTPAISASGTAGNYSSISGNVITGTGDAPGASADPGNVVSFTGVVTEITIQYCNVSAQTIANPGPQTITIEDLSWSQSLPVAFALFDGKAVGSAVALRWQTAWERNSDFFEVQRSQDAKEFVSIGRVDAAYNSDQLKAYTFLDNAPSRGVNYYRLRQMDKGGTTLATTSAIIAVRFDEAAPSVVLLGNPVAEGEAIRVACRNVDPQTLTLKTTTGVTIPCEIRPESITNSVIIPQSRLSPGIYLLGSKVANQVVTLKVVIR